MELDQKALEAARLTAWSKRDGGNIDFDAAIDTAISTYLASLPSDDEVGQLCERLNEHADCTDNGGCAEHQFDSGSKLMREAAALLQSQAAELAAAKAERDRFEAKKISLQDEALPRWIARAERAEAALAEKDKALEPFAAADRAIGDEPGPFRFETGTGHRLIEREHLRAARRAHSKDGGEHG